MVKMGTFLTTVDAVANLMDKIPPEMCKDPVSEGKLPINAQ